MKKRELMILVVGVLLAFNSGTQAVTIDWVTVGNAGNANDDTGHGSVSEVYNIGKYEVTAGQYTEFLNAVAATDTHNLYNKFRMWTGEDGCKIQQSGTSGSYSYSVASDRANRPVNYVSWYDSLRFSNWLHNGQPTGPQNDTTTEDGAYDMTYGSAAIRSGANFWLPNEDEWYKAAYHKNDGVTGSYFDYPTSSDSVPGRDMTEATNPGNNANYYDNGLLIGSPYYRTEVGEFELSDSPYGTFDQGGNVMEWNETQIASSRGVRAGSYYLPDDTLSSTTRMMFYPGDEFYWLGFRVATVPEPCSLVLLFLGGLMLRRRKS